MASAGSQDCAVLRDAFYDDPSQLSQLLRQRAASRPHFHFTASTDRNHLSVSPAKSPFARQTLSSHDAAPPQAPGTLLPRDVTPRRVPIDAGYVKTSLPQHHTAPATAGIAMERDGGAKMFLRHNDAMDVPGDTQPDSQIYRDWTSGIFGSASHQGPAPVPVSLFNPIEHEDIESPTNGNQIVESSQEQQQQPQSPTTTSPTVIHDDEPETQVRGDLDPLTSPLKFETPAMAGRKRDSQGQEISSAFPMTTPGTKLSASAFGFGPGLGNGGIGFAMSLTQVFAATQVGTSPAIAPPVEDPVFQRPSPNFNTQTRGSSPMAVVSSPIKAARSEPHLRSSSEPRAEYVTMKESQELRQRQRELQREDTTATDDHDSWNKPTDAEKRMQQPRAKERFNRETERSLARVSAPPPSSPRSVKKQGLLSISPKYRTPALRRKSTRTYNGPYDSDEVAGSANELSPPPSVDGNISEQSLDELSQDITSSARPVRTQASTVKDKVQVPNTSSHPQRTLSSQSMQNLSPPVATASLIHPEPILRAPASQAHPVSRLRSSKESAIIMDSQPSPLSSVSRPRPLAIPSSPSMGQYSIDNTTITSMHKKNGYTSQVLASSMPPGPPQHSSQRVINDQDVTGDRVPSSPPILTHGLVGNDVDDDDVEEEDGEAGGVVYDEHEHSGDENEEDEDEDEEIERDRSPSPTADMDIDSDSDSSESGNEEDMELDDYVTQDVVEEKDEDSETAEQEGLPALSENELPETQDQENGPDDHHDEVQETADHEDFPDNLRDEVRQTADREYIAEFVHDEVTKSKEFAHEEVIDTEEPEDLPTSQHEVSDVVRPRYTVEQPRLQRQTTVPESDMLSDTQPILFDDIFGNAISNGADSTAAANVAQNQTGSTEPFHTAEEEQTASHSTTSSNRVKGSNAMEQLQNLRSLEDIANQPDTQHSTLDEFELPTSFREEPDDAFADVLGSSPLRPAKKRRVYGGNGKKRAFNTPYMDSSPLSESPSSPLKQVQRARGDTPPSSSIQNGETRGAHAAEAAREQADLARPATLKSALPRKPVKSGPLRKGALKSVNHLIVRSSSSPPRKPLTSTASVPNKSPLSKPTRVLQEDVEMDDRDNASDDIDELAGPTPQPNENDAALSSSSNHCEEPTGPLIVPNRVWALWPGLGYHPATCLGRADASHYRCRYADGNEHVLDIVQVRSLDLRNSDQVKVDETGMKKHVYVIVGFKDKVEANEDGEYPQTDSHGYATVVLEEKQRDSLPNLKVGKGKAIVSVPVEKLYLTQQMWKKYRDRPFHFTPHGTPSASASRVATPNTPGMSRRGTIGPSFLKESINRAGSVASSVHSNGTVFSNMAFAITITLESSDKDAIARHIVSNGGEILEDGFQELFEDIDYDAHATAKNNARAMPPGGADELVLKKEHKDLRFAALITDSHSRRTKYIQALALNIPCLHFRWITDSASSSQPLPFSRYLLPAGISTFLDPKGTVRSRTLELYDPGSEDMNFEGVIGNREQLLQGQRVLIVTGKTKKDLEKKKPYLFLTHALGPDAVGRCTDLDTAKSMIKNGGWGWVYIENGPTGVKNAADVLFHNAQPKSSGELVVKNEKKGKKRKRDEGENAGDIVLSGTVSGNKVSVACDEFVIQSLILGALVDG